MSHQPVQVTRVNPPASKPHEPFERMLDRAEELLKAGFLEFAVLQCHITLDFFINLVLETRFFPRLEELRRSNPEIYKLFVSATWEDDNAKRYVSFLDRFGDYTRAIGLDFKGGNLFEKLKKMNSTRDGIVHNRYYSSSLSEAEVSKFVILSHEIINYYCAHINVQAIETQSRLLTHYCLSDLECNVSVKKGVEKSTKLICDAEVVLHAVDQAGIIRPIADPVTGSQPLLVQICGIDYIRQSVSDANEPGTDSETILPKWANVQWTNIRVNIKFFEPAREVKKVIKQVEGRLAEFIEHVIADQVAGVIASWANLPFAERFRLSSWPTELIQPPLTEEAPSQTLLDLVFTQLPLFVLGPLAAGTFLTLHEIRNLQPSRVILTSVDHPAEADLRRRSLGDKTSREVYVVLPKESHKATFGQFVVKHFNQEAAGCPVEYLGASDFYKSIGLSHKCGHLFSGFSHYDQVASQFPPMCFAVELIDGIPHANSDHWFIIRIMELTSVLPRKGQPAEFGYLIERINGMLEGRYRCPDISVLREKISQTINNAGMVLEADDLLRIDIPDLPPGFFHPDDPPM